MYISHKHKAMFIHIPKTGGTSIKTLLLQNNFTEFNLHQSPDKSNDDITGEYRLGTALRAKRGISDDIWNSYFKFTFVRSPYERMISNYYFLSYNNIMPFNKFITHKLTTTDHIWHSELSQSTHIYSKTNKLLVDYIGRFENLQEDFNIICNKIGLSHITLPHVNKSIYNKDNINELLNHDTKEIIYNKYIEDFNNFGYIK